MIALGDKVGVKLITTRWRECFIHVRGGNYYTLIQRRVGVGGCLAASVGRCDEWLRSKIDEEVDRTHSVITELPLNYAKIFKTQNTKIVLNLKLGKCNFVS